MDTGGEQYVGVREFAAAYSARVGRKVHPSTITRAVQSGRIPKREDGKIPLVAGLQAMATNTDPIAQLGHQLRDGLGLEDAPPHTPSTLIASPGGAGAAPAGGGINAIKTEQARVKLQQDQLDLAERQGRVAEVKPLRAAFVKQIAGFVSQVEVALPDAAQDLAGEFGIERGQALIILRRWYRALRADLAQTARAQAEALPELADTVEAVETPEDE